MSELSVIELGDVGNLNQLINPIKYTCRGPRVLDENNEPVVDEIGLSIRAGCGADVSALIHDVPDDGEDYEVVCPSCGNVVSVMKTVPE